MSARVLRPSVVDAHALWADVYDIAPNPLLSLEERIIIPILPSVEGRLVVDVACGTGRWLRNLVEAGANSAIGLDVSPEMLGKAALKPGLRRRLAQAECEAMPIRDASVGIAICAFGVGYVTRIGDFARELARIVEDRGHLFLSDLHPSAEARGWKRRFRHRGLLIEVPSLGRPLDRVLRAFAEEGFELLHLFEPEFGAADRPMFERAGKEHLFEQSRGQAAIFVCHFRRTAHSQRPD